MTQVLTQEQIERFWRDGVLVVPDAVTSDLLQRLQSQFNAWVEESRSYTNAYGECIDGRARFDLAPEHTSEVPGLRRVQAPSEVSDAFYEAMTSSRMVGIVTDLIGPNVKSHHSKINSKLPRSSVTVKWHQDFAFTPHTNDSVVTALLMLDDVTDENGPLEVVPGTHRGKIFSLWHGGQFTGAVSPDVAGDLQSRAERCLGPAGSVCLMHTRLAHGSTANHSSSPRTLYICVYSADDAVPCSPNPVPNAHEGTLVSGQRSGRIRTQDYEMQLPEYPKQVSFFSQQSKAERGV